MQVDEWLGGDNIEGNTFLIDELNTNFMRLKHIELEDHDYYNDYYSNNILNMECSYWEYSKVDSYSIEGCTNPSYSNYNPYATFNDGTCNNNNCQGYLNNNQDSNRLKLIK